MDIFFGSDDGYVYAISSEILKEMMMLKSLFTIKATKKVWCIKPVGYLQSVEPFCVDIA